MRTVTHFFLGANSGRGFQNLFQRFCAPEEHYDLVVLKGGPGSGKSTLMRRMGAAMEEHGESVEYLHCSGDPESLDGVRIPRIGAAMVDGTAPHVIEPRYPVAVDRYVELGSFCDLAALKARREEVIQHTDACSAAYRRAYRAMGAAAQMADSAAVLAQAGLNEEKLLRRTEGVIRRELRGRGSGGRTSYRFLGSMTCQGGIWRFDSVAALCPRVYQLQDSFGLAAPMLERIRAAAAARDFACVLCPDPEHMERLAHLLLPELGLAFVTSREGMTYSGPTYRRIRLDAMVDPGHCKRHRAGLRFSQRMERALLEEAQEALAEAKRSHDALEAVYTPYMDFAGLDQLAARELRRWESWL